jgi:hypothetical protein
VIDSIFILFNSCLFVVIDKFTFIQLFLRDKDSFSLHLIVDDFTSENVFVVGNDLNLRIFDELLQIKVAI